MAVAPWAIDPLRQPLPRDAVSRPALERRLDGIDAGGLGLLVASAGAGKSVLLRQWSLNRPDLRMAALDIVARHDDSVALARDLVAVIQAAASEFDSSIVDLVMSGGSFLGDSFVSALLSGLDGLSEPIVLILEDLHVLTNHALVADLGRIVSLLPRTSRIVVSTRRDPPWSLHQARLNDRLVEIRGTDLAFNAGEARELLVAVSHRDLTGDQVQTLLDVTDGWPAGLQFAAIALRDAPDVTASIESFAGSDRLVAEYLLEGVIEQQDPEMRRFLFQTAALDWLSVDLCDAVTGTGNAREMLPEVDRRSLFLIRLDRSGELFRYHHLFADLMRYQLRVDDPGAALELHRRAARWLIDHGYTEDAIRHLLEAGEHSQAFEVICRAGHILYERGESATLVTWLSAIDSGPSEAPAVVAVNLLAGQVAADQGDPAAETYRRLTRRPDLTLGERTAANALYAMLVFRDLPPETALKAASDVREALPLLQPDDLVDFLGLGGRDAVLVLAEYAAAGARFMQGDLAQAAATLEYILTLPGVSYPVFKVYVLGLLALVRAWMGYCTEALRLAGSAIESARLVGVPSHAALTHAHLAKALVHLDRIEPQQAAESLAEVDRQNRRRTSSVTYLDLQRALVARLTAVTDGPTEALDVLREPASSIVEAAVVRRANRALQGRLLLGTGDLVQARAVLDQEKTCPGLEASRVDLALAEGDVVTAREVLDGWQPPNDLRSMIGYLLRSCAVFSAEGDSRRSREAIGDAVARAAGERLRWPFLEAPTALRLLRRDESHGTPLADELRKFAVRLEPRSRAQASLVDPLTNREIAVLEYLPTRTANQEIAGELHVSVNTVKTHLVQIYRKLGVNKRDDAVAKARELGLL